MKTERAERPAEVAGVAPEALAWPPTLGCRRGRVVVLSSGGGHGSAMDPALPAPDMLCAWDDRLVAAASSVHGSQWLYLPRRKVGMIKLA